MKAIQPLAIIAQQSITRRTSLAILAERATFNQRWMPLSIRHDFVTSAKDSAARANVTVSCVAGQSVRSTNPTSTCRIPDRTKVTAPTTNTCYELFIPQNTLLEVSGPLHVPI